MISSPFVRNSRALAVLLLAACAADPEEKPKESDSTAPKLVGRIASIPSAGKFVLIQSYGKWTVETGSILTTQGPGERAANLRATGEKLGQYAAADIQSGTLEMGDAVYTISTLPTKSLTSAEPDTVEEIAPAEAVTEPDPEKEAELPPAE